MLGALCFGFGVGSARIPPSGHYFLERQSHQHLSFISHPYYSSASPTIHRPPHPRCLHPSYPDIPSPHLRSAVNQVSELSGLCNFRISPPPFQREQRDTAQLPAMTVHKVGLFLQPIPPTIACADTRSA